MKACTCVDIPKLDAPITTASTCSKQIPLEGTPSKGFTADV